MKNLLIISKRILLIVIITSGLIACNDTSKPADTKEEAIDRNKIQFEKEASEKDEATFFVDIAEMDLTAIEIAQLAEMKSSNEEIKKISLLLIDDHEKSVAELKDLADNREISLPLSVTDDGKDQYNALNEKTGVNFDKKFLDMVIDDHQKAIKKMEKASVDDDKDENVKVWASNRITNLTDHLQQAKMLKEKLYNNN